ncbi:hypothetical protein [Streptomyces cupreus]|uniref:Uncharacterized protein n=1 Tax=Streptomyces cupreus TaxID=2759956 RepID=A0A7X1J6Y8_9ACTN|nr:hypothetical protein [Streptomyces cupreus]MBC2905266.1 hypothetical protein [Streptomyces cupreus]
MNLQEALTRCSTLVIESADGIGRSDLITELAEHGFLIRCDADRLHHVDPTRPYRELFAEPGRLVLSGSIIHELVYGPLLRGESRVSWIQALDFAESVAERDGALIHLTAPRHPPRIAPTAFSEATDAYTRVFRSLSQHVPVVTLDAGDLDRPSPAHGPAHREVAGNKTKLTVG